MRRDSETSWEGSEKWYDTLVGCEGHYYHQQVVIPGVLRLLKLESTSKVLDCGCGQGVLGRAVGKVAYVGLDLSPSLVAKAKKNDPSHDYLVADLTKPLPVKEKFSHASFILSLQNMERPDLALQHVSQALDSKGLVIIVLNHPCFRIPRQSAWGVDQEKKLQYRRIDRYMAPLKIPIQTHPGKGKASEETWTFHHSLSDFSRFLGEAGFAILKLEEWVSDKVSEGKNAKMENRSRAEFPLFLTILAQKIK